MAKLTLAMLSALAKNSQKLFDEGDIVVPIPNVVEYNGCGLLYKKEDEEIDNKKVTLSDLWVNACLVIVCRAGSSPRISFIPKRACSDMRGAVRKEYTIAGKEENTCVPHLAAPFKGSSVIAKSTDLITLWNDMFDAKQCFNVLQTFTVTYLRKDESKYEWDCLGLGLTTAPKVIFDKGNETIVITFNGVETTFKWSEIAAKRDAFAKVGEEHLQSLLSADIEISETQQKEIDSKLWIIPE